MTKILKLLLSRVVICGTLILLQIISIFGLVWGLGKVYTNLYIFLEVISFVLALYIMNSERNPSYKLAWLIVILPFPVFGALFYLFFGMRNTNKRNRRRRQRIKDTCKKYLPQNIDLNEEIKKDNNYKYKNIKYLNDFSYYPVYKNNFCQYLSPGERKYEKLIEELKKSKKFIFLEYFIIKKGYMWDNILNILEKKVKEGLEVRVIYDDFGCLFTLPDRYYKILRSKGIKCQVFNPLVPFINIYMNHRDHRKITVIDGRVGFVGGTNLADEYINKDNRLGHWKDCDIMVKGEPVWSLTVMFLQMWNFFKDKDGDWEKFKVKNIIEEDNDDGYIQPFGDVPVDYENVSENTYKNLINGAREYIYISTPYLIVDNEVRESLILAAKNGIDVKIICPKTADKKSVYLVTNAFFPSLIKAGVKIYLYTPGFIHSKLIISDDDIGMVGTANMDYRSFYLHFETNILLYKSKVINDIKIDFLDTLKKCEEVTLEKTENISVFMKICQSILRIFSPMM